MWIYEKKLEYPVKIKQCDPRLAKIVIAQYGGPYGVYDNVSATDNYY